MKENQSAPTKLLLSNVPVNCGDEYLRQWVEARGYSVSNVKLITDVVSGTSPSFAYVQLMNSERPTRRSGLWTAKPSRATAFMWSASLARQNNGSAVQLTWEVGESRYGKGGDRL